MNAGMSQSVAALALFLVACSLPVRATEASLICFGNEPSWGLSFTANGRARLELADRGAVEYRGRETGLAAPKERAWRGRPTSGRGGELVGFLSDATCSDNMSEVQHPLTARVSLPDGRLLVGCCRFPSAARTPPPAMTIEGPTWRLTAIGGGKPDPAGQTGRPVTARFEAGRVDGFSGCNQFFGGYTIDGDRISFAPLAGTMMACAAPAMALEKSVQGVLAGTVRYAIDGDRLTLTPATGAALAFQAEPPPTLAGVVWHVTGFNNGRDAVVGPLVGTDLTLSFADGMVRGHAGCNSFRAPYSSDGERMTVGPALTTRKACAGEGVMQQEQEFLAALATATKWSVRGGMLDVHRADGQRVLNANAETR
ncbi:META domain-containing protein [Accumulibacter sp.]|uniref:META domain-containing protein n=1 Tax=Accumulibacter sp. TaxID=2053492 RepID=UPI0025CE2EFE|nr:META domain-containing protein [Accumulibacter sp.]MCM8614061.1 META domain-containing protein [Accumulibacter sp.]MCM8637834.1 META domain-containing protein [Accumulibacter sp.]MCM8641189.1 META domain-containing protein [Accumulibacter sp.]